MRWTWLDYVPCSFLSLIFDNGLQWSQTTKSPRPSRSAIAQYELIAIAAAFKVARFCTFSNHDRKLSTPCEFIDMHQEAPVRHYGAELISLVDSGSAMAPHQPLPERFRRSSHLSHLQLHNRLRNLGRLTIRGHVPSRVRRHLKHHIESCSQFIIGFEKCVVSNDSLNSLMALFHRFVPDILDGTFVIP